MFRYHTNIEFFLKKEMSNCFSAGISQCAAVEHHLPSPRVAETIDQSRSRHRPEVHTIRGFTKTMRWSKRWPQRQIQATATLQLLPGIVHPTLLAKKSLNWKIATLTSTFGEANTFCTASTKARSKGKKQAIHSHGHWLIDPVFCRSIGASSARGATVSPPPQPILFVLSRIKNNCTTSRNCQIRWPGVCFKGLFRSMLRASLSSERQKPESLSGVCFAESLSPKSKIPALLKVGTLAKKNANPYPPWN